MGDKPSVEVKREVDENDLCHFESVRPVPANVVADNILTDNSALNSLCGTSPPLPDNEHLVNGILEENNGCYNSPTSPSHRFVVSGRNRSTMKQSRSTLGHNMNGDDGAVWYRNTVSHSASVDARLTSVDDVPAHPADTDLNCEVTSGHNDTIAENRTSAPTVAADNSCEPLSSPSSSSSVTVVSVVHADGDGRYQQSGIGELSASTCSSPMFPVRHSGASGGSGDMLAPRDRTKHTLGDVLGEIESRSASLLQQTDYTVLRAVADLQFLAHQSRYSTDLNIKRRIITKLVDSGLINIIVRILSGASEVLDCYYDQCVSSNAADRASLTGSVDADSYEVDQLSDGMKNLRAVITLAWNATDKSSLLCQQCVGRGVVAMLLRLLDSPRLAVSELLHATDKTRMFVVKGCLGILGCIVRSCDDDTTHEVYRNAGAVKSLQQFLRCSLLAVRTKSLMILSYIAMESENDIIHSSDKNLVFAVKMLQSALESDNHYSSKYGYWAVEIVSGVNRLAGYEANKERLFAAGLLSLCFQLLDGSCSDDEVLVATQTFWILSFNSSVRSEVKSSQLYMQVLEQLAANHAREEIKRTAASVVWMLRYFTSLSSLSSPSSVSRGITSLPGNDAAECNMFAVAAIKEAEGSAVSNNRVLVISHHTSGQIVLKVRSHLRAAGYRVHIDPDMRSGSSGMETLVENVDRSAVVLVFLSNRLKNSAACRSEVEYALSTGGHKSVVPVSIHRSYVMDGWLSAALIGHGVVNFTDGGGGSQEEFDTGMSQLLQRLAVITGIAPLSVNTTDNAGLGVGSESHLSQQSPQSCTTSLLEVISPTQTTVTSTVASTTASTSSTTAGGGLCSVALWSSDNVQNWLHDNDLDFVSDRFADMTGSLLIEVRRMQCNAPESFYSSLRSDLSLDFITMMKFTRALSTLDQITSTSAAH